MRKLEGADRVDHDSRRDRAHEVEHERKSAQDEAEGRTTPLTTKAITWLRVRAEMHDPMARNAPAIRRLPT